MVTNKPYLTNTYKEWNYENMEWMWFPFTTCWPEKQARRWQRWSLKDCYAYQNLKITKNGLLFYHYEKWFTILSLINNTSTLQVLKTKDYIHVDCKTGGFLWKHQCISVIKAMNDLLSSWLWNMEIMKSLAIKHATPFVFLSVFLYINRRSNFLTNNEFKCI